MCGCLTLFALATAAAANLVAPELTISEDSSRILMISAREHRVYSRWDKTNHRALSPYGRAMADAVRARSRLFREHVCSCSA